MVVWGYNGEQLKGAATVAPFWLPDGNFLFLSIDGESKAYQNSSVDARHCLRRQFPDAFFQPPFIESADLFQKNHAILGEPVSRRKLDMGRQTRFSDFACYSGGDDGRGILVPDVVLNDQHRSNSALFATDDGGKIRIIQFTSFDLHKKYLF